MPSEIINTAVLIPNAPNWATRPRWSRKWQTAITGGVTGAEDRAALRSTPLESLEFSLLAELGEREALTARLQTALKSGRACVPRWDLPQYLVTDAEPRRARTTTAHHKWEPGHYAIFFRPATNPVNLYLAINCGGRATGAWREDTAIPGKKVVITDPVAVPAAPHAAPAAVYQSKREVTGVNKPGRLVYTVTGWDPLVVCQVRLHFAEIAEDFAQLVNIAVKGATTLTTENHQPYATTGDFKRGEVLGYDLLPDADGRIEISLVAAAGYQPDYPEGPTLWPVSLNGFEVVQNGVTLDQPAYEVRELARHTIRGTLHWETPLTGRYPAGSLFYPLLFGKPSVGDLAALTDHLGDLRLKLEEPLGAGDVATPGTCPAETPYVTAVIYNDGYAPEWVGASCPAPRSTGLASKYVWGFDGNLNVTLTAEQIAWHIAMFENEKAEYPGVTWGPTYWQLTAVVAVRLSADIKYGTGITDPNDPTSDIFVSYNYHTTLAAEYCPGGGGGEPPPSDALTPSYAYCQP